MGPQTKYKENVNLCIKNRINSRKSIREGIWQKVRFSKANIQTKNRQGFMLRYRKLKTYGKTWR